MHLKYSVIRIIRIGPISYRRFAYETSITTTIETGVWARVSAKVAVASPLIDTTGKFVHNNISGLPRYGLPANCPEQ